MTPALTRLTKVLGVVVVFGAMGVSAAAVSSIVARRIGQPATSDVRSRQTAADYRSATNYSQGVLTAHAAKTVRRGRDSASLAVVLVVRGSDVRTCEDLGRQLRELRRALGPTRPIIVLTDSSSVEMVGNFLALEHVASVSVAAESLTNLYSEPITLAMPAVLLVDWRDSVVQAVSHPQRFPDARVRSFSSELTALGLSK